MADFKFQNLNDSIRKKMYDEVNFDISRDELYKSKKRFTSEGKLEYSNLILEAVTEGTEKTLTNKVKTYIKQVEIVNGKQKKVPSYAASLFCQSEFNKFYIRAVCIEAVENKLEFVEVYRARESSRSRPESQRLIGTKINAQELLDDLRESTGATPKLLPDINSGLSVKIIDK